MTTWTLCKRYCSRSEGDVYIERPADALDGLHYTQGPAELRHYHRHNYREELYFLDCTHLATIMRDIKTKDIIGWMVREEDNARMRLSLAPMDLPPYMTTKDLVGFLRSVPFKPDTDSYNHVDQIAKSLKYKPDDREPKPPDDERCVLVAHAKKDLT